MDRRISDRLVALERQRAALATPQRSKEERDAAIADFLADPAAKERMLERNSPRLRRVGRSRHLF